MCSIRCTVYNGNPISLNSYSLFPFNFSVFCFFFLPTVFFFFFFLLFTSLTTDHHPSIIIRAHANSNTFLERCVHRLCEYLRVIQLSALYQVQFRWKLQNGHVRIIFTRKLRYFIFEASKRYDYVCSNLFFFFSSFSFFPFFFALKLDTVCRIFAVNEARVTKFRFIYNFTRSTRTPRTNRWIANTYAKC